MNAYLLTILLHQISSTYYNAFFYIIGKRGICLFSYIRVVPEQIGLTEEPVNPALPPSKKALPSRFRPPPKSTFTSTRGIGSKRVYLDIQARPPNVAYPPRPVPGSVADLDVVMEHCDFSQNKVCLIFFLSRIYDVLLFQSNFNCNLISKGTFDLIYL